MLIFLCSEGRIFVNMMQIVYFSGKSQFLTEMQNLSGEKTFITPSPAKADGLRSMLQETSSSDVVTIAKFTSDLIKHLFDNQSIPEIKRKADLLLIFGILKNKYLPELGYEQFNQAYNLFSDLRSYTLNEDALNSIMEEQSPEVKKAVELFWRLLEITGYLDEHGAYQKIAEALRSSEEISEMKKCYIFWGFQHLNGQQIDLLKALSIRYQVIIPFPLSLKNKLKKSDWISWLRESRVSEIDLEVVEGQPKAKWLRINSREISLNLKQVLQPGDQVVLGVSKLSPLHLDFIPSKNVFYKIPHQLIQSELQQLHDEIKVAMKGKESFTGLADLLKTKRAEVLGEIGHKHAFKMLKALELYQDALRNIQELTDDQIKVDRFFLKLLHEVVSLNQPRTSYIPVAPQKLDIDLKDMSSLEDMKPDRRVLLCIDERFDELLGLGQNYTETIQKSLTALGPVKRNELELLFKQWEFLDLLKRAEVLVMMSETTLKHSLIWKRLFSEVELLDMDVRPVFEKRELLDYFKNIEKKMFSGSFSASKFQTFMDCPRKFYFNYVDKIFPSISLETDFDPLVSGTISHKIIEDYFKKNLSESELPELVRKVMQEYIRIGNFSLTPDKLLKHELVFNHRSLNGIQFLKRIEDLLGTNVQWTIEKEFSLSDSYEMKGKIDCLGKSGNITFLLDFKSTKHAASSFKEIENLESLQLWAYAKAAEAENKNFSHSSVVLGYVALDNPSESNLLFSDLDLAEKFKASKICRTQNFKTSFPEIFRAAEEKMLSVSLAIQSEKNYPAQPRKASACQFCELTKVCVKSEISHE